MTRWGMVLDLTRCIGCNACTVACKIENGTPPDHYWARVYTEETGTFPDVQTTYVPALCNHCADAPCVERASTPVCPRVIGTRPPCSAPSGWMAPRPA